MRQATDESIVLLKNENNTLPLDRAKLKTIAVIGPWTGEVLLDWYSGTPPYAVSMFRPSGNTPAAQKSSIAMDRMWQRHRLWRAKRMSPLWLSATIRLAMPDGINARPPQTAKKTWIAKPSCWSRKNWSNRCSQPTRIRSKFCARAFPMPLSGVQQNLPAIVHMTHNSQEEGHGLADVLFGDYPPAGRLNQTWPTGDAQLLPIMDYDIRHGRTYMYAKEKPLYAFGYGLSYTTFAYEGLRISAPAVDRGRHVKVTVKVKNIGLRASDEVVQMYVSIWARWSNVRNSN